MEKASNVYVLPASFGWSDLGTWSSVQDHLKADINGNAMVGHKILLNNSKDTLVVNTGSKVIVADGLEGYVVAEGEKAILIYPKEKEQEIKAVVNDVRIKWGEGHV
jgi:mannose-1-phosphate guanylyltransferase